MYKPTNVCQIKVFDSCSGRFFSLPSHQLSGVLLLLRKVDLYVFVMSVLLYMCLYMQSWCLFSLWVCKLFINHAIEKCISVRIDTWIACSMKVWVRCAFQIVKWECVNVEYYHIHHLKYWSEALIYWFRTQI